MAIRTIRHVDLAMLSAAVPEEIYELSGYPHFSDEESRLFTQVTGIERKRHVQPGQTAADLCELAARKLLENGGPVPESIDALVFVSQTRDYIFPSTATVLQHKLKLPSACLALDIGLGCSGFVYGLAVLSAMMESGQIRNALLLCGDTCSRTTSEQDPTFFPLMGDAGTALWLRYREDAPAMYFSMHSDGSGYEDLIIPGGGFRQPCTTGNMAFVPGADGIPRRITDARMQGDKILSFSLREVATDIRTVLSDASTNPDVIDYYVLHQANKVINESIRKQLRQPREKFPLSLPDFGNTGVATIPLTIVSRIGENTSGRPLNWILSGFGVGLSWATVYAQTSDLRCLPLSTLPL